MCLAPEVFNAVFSDVVYYILVIWLFYWKMNIFIFWCWVLVIGRYAIMFRLDTIFLPLTVLQSLHP